MFSLLTPHPSAIPVSSIPMANSAAEDVVASTAMLAAKGMKLTDRASTTVEKERNMEGLHFSITKPAE